MERKLLRKSKTNYVPDVEHIQDLDELTLKEAGRFLAAYRFGLFRESRAAVRNGYITEDQSTVDGVPREKFERALEWNKAHDCDTIDGLNRHVRNGTFRELIQDAEQEKTRELDQAIGTILEAIQRMRVMIIAGPSTSGKTPTTERIRREVERRLEKEVFNPIEVDDYFHSLGWYAEIKYRLDGKQKIDRNFEVPEAYILELLHEHIHWIIRGLEVMRPRYDFVAGKSILDAKHFQLREGQILLLDCLHGLHPQIRGFIIQELKKYVDELRSEGKTTEELAVFGLYIEAMNPISGPDGNMQWTDGRLIRRTLRDTVKRNHPPLDILVHWPVVRHGERKGIFPYNLTADVIVNGGLPYELTMFKPLIFEIMKENMRILERNLHSPQLVEAYLFAERIVRLLESVEELPPEEWQSLARPWELGIPKEQWVIPPNSIIRESLGGLSY